jgi:hypothetical protein
MGNHKKHIVRKIALIGVLVTSVVGLSGVAAVGATVSRFARPVTGYAYVCEGAALVPEVDEHYGERVVVTGNVEDPNSADDVYEVFQAPRLENCAAMAASFRGRPGHVARGRNAGRSPRWRGRTHASHWDQLSVAVASQARPAQRGSGLPIHNGGGLR